MVLPQILGNVIQIHYNSKIRPKKEKEMIKKLEEKFVTLIKLHMMI